MRSEAEKVDGKDGPVSKSIVKDWPPMIIGPRQSEPSLCRQCEGGE
jgi:hypothetical protein